MIIPEPKYDFLALLMFTGVLQGTLIGLLLLQRTRSNLPNLLLGSLGLVLVLSLVEIFLNHTRLMLRALYLYNFTESLQFLIGPLLLLYSQKLNHSVWRRIDWLHFLPFVFFTAYLFLEFTAPIAQKYNNYIANYYPFIRFVPVAEPAALDPWHIRPFFTSTLIYLQLGLYIVLSIQQFRVYFNSRNKASRRKWLRNLVIFSALGFMLFLLTKWLLPFATGENVVGIFLTLFVYMIGFSMLQDSGFLKPEKARYANPGLDSAFAEEKISRLQTLLGVEKVFLNADLSMADLAQNIGIPEHQLSRLINEHLQTNFFGLVNQYRVEEAKKMLEDPNMNHLKVEEIGYRSGYNSKSVFFNAFKKVYGTTPSAHRNL